MAWSPKFQKIGISLASYSVPNFLAYFCIFHDMKGANFDAKHQPFLDLMLTKNVNFRALMHGEREKKSNNGPSSRIHIR